MMKSSGILELKNGDEGNDGKIKLEEVKKLPLLMVIPLDLANDIKFIRCRRVGVVTLGVVPCDDFMIVYHALQPLEQEIFMESADNTDPVR
jgi:hypothetical protein